MRTIRNIMLVTATVIAIGTSVAAQQFREVIALPTGFQPEGIAVGSGPTFFVSSIPTGAIYRGDLRTGRGAVLVPAQPGRAAFGLAVDARQRLFVAGATTGQAYVYDARTGAEIAVYQLAPGQPTAVNDVVITKDAAWFTDSFRPVLYRIPIAPNGTLGGQGDVEEVPLTGDFVQQAGFNANGIDASPNGNTLIIVQFNTGKLFRVDPVTGTTVEVELSGGDVVFGDGIRLDGKRLYVVQIFLNRVAVIDLARDFRSGNIVEYLSSPALDVPTTIAVMGHWLYAVNARFGTPNPESADYEIVRVSK